MFEQDLLLRGYSEAMSRQWQGLLNGGELVIVWSNSLFRMWGAAGTAARAGMVIADVQDDEFLSKKAAAYHFPAEFL